MAIDSMKDRDYKWFRYYGGHEGETGVTRTVLLSNPTSRKGEINWNTGLHVYTMKDLTAVSCIPLNVNGVSTRFTIHSSLGNSGDVTEQNTILGYVRLEVTYEGVCYRKWIVMRIRGGAPVWEYVHPMVSAILTKRVQAGTHSMAPIYTDYRDCVQRDLPLVDLTLSPVGNSHAKLPVGSQSRIRGEKIAICGEVWTRIGKSSSGTQSSSNLKDMTSFAWRLPIVSVSQAVMVTGEGNTTFTLRPGRYILPPHEKWWSMNVQSIGGSLNRAKNSFASATNVSVVDTNKQSSQRALRRL